MLCTWVESFESHRFRRVGRWHNRTPTMADIHGLEYSYTRGSLATLVLYLLSNAPDVNTNLDSEGDLFGRHPETTQRVQLPLTYRTTRRVISSGAFARPAPRAYPPR